MAKLLRVPRPRLTRRAALVFAGAAMSLCALPATAAASHRARVGDQAEAWFASSPVSTCATPAGCPPSGLPSPYPADTLHVGVAGGQETARAYVVPDLSALPFDATAQTGTMTLPVATDTQSGTQSPQTAAIKACLATQPAQDGVEGSAGSAPSADCAVSAAATYAARQNAFTIDLTPFLSAWTAGRAQDGIALVADTSKSQPTDAWHVAFNGRHRAGVAHIGSVLTYTTSAAGSAGSPLAAAPPATSVPTAGSPADAQHLSLPPSQAGTEPNVPAPQVAPQQPTTLAQQPVAFTRGFAYPLAFLTPLALLAAAVFLVRLFTRDATPLGLRS